MIDDRTIPELVENGVMTKKFYECLVQVFDYYDKDQDGAWNHTELNDFFKCVNNVDVDKNTEDFLRKNFAKNRKGWITKEGFLQLYLSQTAGGADETWKDLGQLGFDQLLNPTDNRYSKTSKK